MIPTKELIALLEEASKSIDTNARQPLADELQGVACMLKNETAKARDRVSGWAYAPDNAHLDLLVATALGWKTVMWGNKTVWVQASGEGRFRCNAAEWRPSKDWSQAGPIIEHENIILEPGGNRGECCAHIWDSENINWIQVEGPSPLIAAMRCFVTYKLRMYK